MHIFVPTRKAHGFFARIERTPYLHLAEVWPFKGPVPKVDGCINKKSTTVAGIRNFLNHEAKNMTDLTVIEHWPVEIVNLCRLDQKYVEELYQGDTALFWPSYRNTRATITGVGDMHNTKIRVGAGSWSYKRPPWVDDY